MEPGRGFWDRGSAPRSPHAPVLMQSHTHTRTDPPLRASALATQGRRGGGDEQHA